MVLSSSRGTSPRLRICRIILLAAGFLSVESLSQTLPDEPRKVFDRAVSDFQNGRIEDSVAGFDRLAGLAPNVLPHLWQRGIALYYAGRFDDCRAQFEIHRTVNPNDVENAAWHFLCVARAESAGKAKMALLPVGPDSRVPMAQIYRMFRGELDTDQVLQAGGTQAESQFYAELYVGLYLDAVGDANRALRHIRNAAADRYSSSGYMHRVARIHRDRLLRKKEAAKP